MSTHVAQSSPRRSPGPPLTAVELRVLNFVEQYWQATGGWPSITELGFKHPEFKLQASLAKPAFTNALRNRGVDLPSVEDAGLESSLGSLSEEQVAAVSVVTNWADKRSKKAKLAEIGVSLTQWNGWLRTKKFKQYLHRIATLNFNDSVDHAQAGLMAAVDKGDVSAIKFYYEVTGRYVPGQNNQETENLKVVISKLMEAIQQTVDPDTLDEIQRRFELIMTGAKPVEIEAGPARIVEGL